MKELEDYLRGIRKPAAETAAFQRRLRRDLLESHPAARPPARSFRTAWILSTACSFLLAAMVLLFVIEPGYAERLHDLVWREAHPGDPGAKPVVLPDPMAADRAFVRYWAEQSLETRPVDVTPVDDIETYTVSRFRLNDGKTVQVCTRLPMTKLVRKVSY